MSKIADDFPYWAWYTAIIENCIKADGLRGSFSCGGFLYAHEEVRQMPRKPKRPCSFPGCPKLTDGRFCEEHGKQENRRYEKYDRDPAVRRRYGRAWKRIRDRYAVKHPFCEECYKKGLLHPVEEVHHKLPLAEGGTHDESNLVSLCQSCHARIHAGRGDRWHKY